MNDPNLLPPSAAMGPEPAPGPSPLPCRPPGWQSVTADSLISAKPVDIYAIVVSATAVACIVTFWDGPNAAASRSFRIRAPANWSDGVVFPAGLRMEYGLFVDVDANTLEVLVQYEPVPGA